MRNYSRLPIYILIFISALFLASCTPEADITTPSATSVPTGLPEPSATAEILETSAPVPTAEAEIEVAILPTEVIVEDLIILEDAQDFPFQTTYAIALGDLDGDGDLDVVFANQHSNDSEVWLNDGAGNFENTGQKLTRQAHGVDLADIDGDGDLDAAIVCIEPDSSLRRSKIYINDGAGYFTDSLQELDDLISGGGEVNFIDVESDGDADLHIFYYPDINFVYANDGNGQFAAGVELMPGRYEWDDLNNDGYVDVFLKQSENKKMYQAFLNDGTGNFFEYWQMSDLNIAYGEVLLGDYDADGDPDIFIPNGDRGQLVPSMIYFNNGDGSFEDSGQELEITLFAHTNTGDLNGDGYLDILISNGWMHDQILLNDGNGFFYDSGLVLDENNHSTISALGDLDGDGDLDIMVGSYRSPIDYWFNETSALSTASSNLYLGQTPPGDTPEIFAPGFISTEDGSEYSSTFSPDGKEFYFTRVGSNGWHYVYFTRLEDGQWTTPQLVPFNNSNPGFGGSEALITPDGKKLFFMSKRPLPGETELHDRPNMWMVERIASGWTEPEFFGSDMMYVTQAANETIYFTDISAFSHFFVASRVFSDGEYAEQQEVEIPALGFGSYGHPFIAPDESYLIFNSIPNDGNMDLFIIFKMEDGTWSEPQSFGESINTNTVEFAGMVTPDGKYFFFTHSSGTNGEPADIYWVSTSIFDALKSQASGKE